MHWNERRTALLTAVSALAFGLMGSEIAAAQTTGNSLGIFENQSDVGSVTPPGTATFDAATGVYTIRSSGEDLWANVDEFHFVWKKVSGDVSLTADVKIADGSATSHPSKGAANVPADARFRRLVCSRGHPMDRDPSAGFSGTRHAAKPE